MDMQHITLKITLAASLLCLSPAKACTLVFWNTNGISPMVGRTMDLYRNDHPHVVVYPRGLERDGETRENTLHWKSKYGSVVVTAFNTNAATDGLNEAGFAASLLYLGTTAYENRDFSKPSLSVALWAQYMLDNYKTVSEAIAGLSEFQVISMPIGDRTWPIHMAIQDKTGDMAIIEYVQGQMNVYHGPQYRVLSNEPPYGEQLSNLKRYQSFKGTLSMPGDVDSMSRFVRASSYLKTLPQPKSETEAATFLMSLMRTVMVPEGAEDTSGHELNDAWPTRWVTVKDLKHQIFYIHVTTTPNMTWIDLHTLKFKKGSPILSIDPTRVDLTGDIQDQLATQ